MCRIAGGCLDAERERVSRSASPFVEEEAEVGILVKTAPKALPRSSEVRWLTQATVDSCSGHCFLGVQYSDPCWLYSTTPELRSHIYMFGSPSINSHRLRQRDLRGSPLATYYRSTQGQTIITIHVSSAHARKDVISLLVFRAKKRKYEFGGNRTHYPPCIGYCYTALHTGPRSLVTS